MGPCNLQFDGCPDPRTAVDHGGGEVKQSVVEEINTLCGTERQPKISKLEVLIWAVVTGILG